MFSHCLDFAESLERGVNILMEEVFRCIIFEKVSKIEDLKTILISIFLVANSELDLP